MSFQIVNNNFKLRYSPEYSKEFIIFKYVYCILLKIKTHVINCPMQKYYIYYINPLNVFLIKNLFYNSYAHAFYIRVNIYKVNFFKYLCYCNI